MILKTTKYIFIWIGRTSSQSERLNAFRMAAKMRSQCKQLPEITTVDDGYEQSMQESKKKIWNDYLNLAQRVVHPSDSIMTAARPIIRLYRCGFNNGKYRIEEIQSSTPQQSDMNDSRAYIIDCGAHFGVWIWVGRFAERKDKLEAMRNARGFVKKVNGRGALMWFSMLIFRSLSESVSTIDPSCTGRWWLRAARVHSNVSVVARNWSKRQQSCQSTWKIRCNVTGPAPVRRSWITVDWQRARRTEHLPCEQQWRHCRSSETQECCTLLRRLLSNSLHTNCNT